jgi:hypothetical protein
MAQERSFFRAQRRCSTIALNRNLSKTAASMASLYASASSCACRKLFSVSLEVTIRRRCRFPSAQQQMLLMLPEDRASVICYLYTAMLACDQEFMRAVEHTGLILMKYFTAAINTATCGCDTSLVPTASIAHP